MIHTVILSDRGLLLTDVKTIGIQKNNFAALSVGNGRKRPIPSPLPCETNFLRVYIISRLCPFLHTGYGMLRRMHACIEQTSF
jgi:hypothetical protein